MHRKRLFGQGDDSSSHVSDWCPRASDRRPHVSDRCPYESDRCPHVSDRCSHVSDRCPQQSDFNNTATSAYSSGHQTQHCNIINHKD